ncbi:LOW QUALITY PROTEIN: uncharacterized protein RG961_002073 [Leptosomus discolor]
MEQILLEDMLKYMEDRHGSIPCPQLCLALRQLQGLSSGKGVTGDAAEKARPPTTSRPVAPVSPEYYRNALQAVKEENDSLVERHMKLMKEQALENAVRYDTNSHRAIEENAWLKEEVKMYQKEVSDLEASIWLLEEENIGLVKQLIDGRLQNLRVPRHLFLTQAAGLQDDFLKDEIKEECLKLDPLETKLMCVVGRAVPLHKEPEETPSRSHKGDGITGKSDGHITVQMIKVLSKQKIG